MAYGLKACSCHPLMKGQDRINEADWRRAQIDDDLSSQGDASKD